MRGRRHRVAAFVVPILTVAAAPPIPAIAQPVGVTTRISVGVNGVDLPLRGPSYNPSLSAGGTFVGFDSDAGDLVPDDTNDVADAFVRDRIRRRTIRISISSAGTQGNDGSFNPSISADGRFAAFSSKATNLVPGDRNGIFDVFVRDIARSLTTIVSVDPLGRQFPKGAYGPSMSPDGRFVAFTALDAYGSNVYVRDLIENTTTLASVPALGGHPGDGGAYPGTSDSPAISRDGRYVAFVSNARLVGDDTNYYDDIYVRDLVARTTDRVSVSTEGRPANDYSFEPSISWDGRFVAYMSWAGNLVAGDSNRCARSGEPEGTLRSCKDVFLYDRLGRRTTVVSAGPDGIGNSASASPSLSADGLTVAFTSVASNLVAGDDDDDADILVKDLRTGSIELASVPTCGRPSPVGSSDDSALSADGRHVGFQSDDPALTTDDVNVTLDVFVRDRGASSCATRPMT